MNKLIDHIFTKETFINGIKANYNDLIWILQNILINNDFLKKIREFKKRIVVCTL